MISQNATDPDINLRCMSVKTKLHFIESYSCYFVSNCFRVVSLFKLSQWLVPIQMCFRKEQHVLVIIITLVTRTIFII